MIGNSENRGLFLPATSGQAALAPVDARRGLRLVEGNSADDISFEDYRGMGDVVDAEGNVIPPQSEVKKSGSADFYRVFEFDDEDETGYSASKSRDSSGSRASAANRKAGSRPAVGSRPVAESTSAVYRPAGNTTAKSTSAVCRPAGNTTAKSTPAVCRPAGNVKAGTGKPAGNTPAAYMPAGDTAVSAVKPMAGNSSVVHKQADNQTLNVSKTSVSYSPRATLNNYSPRSDRTDARQTHVTAIDNRVSNSNNTNHIHVGQTSRLMRFLVAAGISAIIGLLTFNAVMLYRNNRVPVGMAPVAEVSAGEKPAIAPVFDTKGSEDLAPVQVPDVWPVANPEPAEINVSRIVDAGNVRGDGNWDNRGHDYDYGLFAQTRNEYAFLNAEGMYRTMTGTICSNLERGAAGIVKIYNGDTLIYTSPSMNELSAPVDFDVDITGADLVKVEWELTDDYKGGLCIAEGLLNP